MTAHVFAAPHEFVARGMRIRDVGVYYRWFRRNGRVLAANVYCRHVTVCGRVVGEHTVFAQNEVLVPGHLVYITSARLAGRREVARLEVWNGVDWIRARQGTVIDGRLRITTRGNGGDSATIRLDVWVATLSGCQLGADRQEQRSYE